GVAEHALGHLRELHQVPVRERLARAAKSVEAILDVSGVARLAHLAIAGDGDAGVALLADHLRHRPPDARGESGPVDRDTLLLGEHHPDQVVRPRQAPGVRGQEVLEAAIHRLGLPKRMRAAQVSALGSITVTPKYRR